jgi:hypothetical protein
MLIDGLRRGLFISLLVSAAASASAQTVPATFGDPEEERHLIKFFKLPDIRGDYSVMLRCFASIEKSGKMKDVGCYNSTEAEYALMQALQKAAKKARLTPALIDGKPRKIYLQFRAQFVGKGDDHNVSLYLNPAEPENIEAYGEHHVAAQRVIGKEPWQGVCPSRAGWLVFARAHVSMDGEGSSVDLSHGGGIVPTGPCQQAIIDTLIASEYVPTMVDGEPVPSTFIEGFSN